MSPVLAEHTYDVSPVTDDSPFFWHFARFRDATGRRADVEKGLLDFEDAIGERVLLAMLAVSALFAAVFLLLPFVVIRQTWSTFPHNQAWFRDSNPGPTSNFTDGISITFR